MTGDGASVERLRQYLRELKPPARSLLITELERGLLRGEGIAGADLVLQELRRIIRDQREGAPRIGNSARMFYTLLEPFMVDDVGDHKHPGRIARSSLEPLWTWIRRDLLPEETKKLTDEVSEALLASDELRTNLLIRDFQDQAATAIATALTAADSDEKSRRRLFAQIGTPRAAEDALTLMRVLKGRDILQSIATQLPVHIAHLDGVGIDNAKGLVDTVAAHDAELFVYALLIVMNRLAAPWQLVRLAIKAAGSDRLVRVSETPYKIAVDIVLAELDRLIGELRNDLRSGKGVAVGALLKIIHDCARGLRTELELPPDSGWGRQLAHARAQISELLKSEIESMPGRARRLLRPRPSTEIRANAVLDADDVAETEALIEFVGNCRHFANELAINEMTQRAFTDVQQYLDNGTRALLDGLRHAGPSDRPFRQSQVDAAARFCAKVFGKDYGSMLSKAAEVAGSAERKQA